MNYLDIRYKTLYPECTLAKDLIDQLNEYRLDKKLTEVQLAKKLDVTFQTVNRWLNHHMKPGPIHEHQIKKLLGKK